MKRYLLALLFCFFSLAAHAWNGAGHRLVALIAWQQLGQESQQAVMQALAAHPDFARWQDKTRGETEALIFAEAATWADNIRNDPRYYDERRDSPAPPLPGLIDNARHTRWHYADLDRHGQAAKGELDVQIKRLSELLRSTRNERQIVWALPWLLHLLGDIHQPLHVGHADDAGGNLVDIEQPQRRQPFKNLHSYWDELPGPSSLRGRRLEKRARELVDRYAPPPQTHVDDWKASSHDLLNQAYPDNDGNLLPVVSEAFERQAREIADRQIVAAGYRLGRLLDSIFRQRVSRETR